MADRETRRLSFGSVATDYDRYRPPPPPQALDWLIPPGAQAILDLAAGTGVVTRELIGRAARVVAVEPDRRKVLPSYRHPRVAFVAGYADALSGEGSPFDAVTILDVLYRIPLAGWDPLLRHAHGLLAPGGLLLLKEIDPEDRWKGAWNRAQEKAADLLGLTLGDAFAYETRQQMRERLTRLGFTDFAAHDLGAGYPHAHILYIARRPG